MAENAPDMNVQQIASFSGNRETAYKNFQDALTSIGAENIDFVFGVGDDAVLGAITACEEAGVEIPKRNRTSPKAACSKPALRRMQPGSAQRPLKISLLILAAAVSSRMS